MPNNIKDFLYSNADPAATEETRVYQALSRLHETLRGKAQLRFPEKGEIARREHLDQPFSEIQKSSAQVQDALLNVMSDIDETARLVQRDTDSVRQQLQQLRNEINYWKTQQSQDTHNVQILTSRFESGFTLTMDNDISIRQSISKVDFIADKTSEKPDGRLAKYHYSFINQFEPGTSEDAAQRLRNGQGISINVSARHSAIDELSDYLNTQFETVHGLTRLTSPPFVWFQDAIDDTEGISLNGTLALRLEDAPSISFLKSSLDMQWVEYIALVDPHGHETRLPAVNDLYFAAQRVALIYYRIKETLNARRIPYTLYAHPLAVTGSDGMDAYVYYRDTDAEQIEKEN